MYLPNRAVEGCNTHDIPFGGNPAPQSCVAVHSTPFLCGHEDECQRNYERNAIAGEEVRYLHLAKLLGVKLAVECQPDIHSHGQGPECVCGHEPESVSLASGI